MISVHKNKIVDVFYDKNGKKHIQKNDFKPSIFLESNSESKFKSIYGKNLTEKSFDSIHDYKYFVRDNNDLIPLHGNIGPEYQYINDKYSDIEFCYDKMKVFIYDIEVISEDGSFPEPEKAEHPIVSIVIKDKHKNMFYVLSLKPYEKNETILKIDPSRLKFKHCKDEEDLLKTFITILKNERPDFLIGWYSAGFDHPYIINRCYNILPEKTVKQMSMFGTVTCSSREINGRLVFDNKIGGITLLDYLELYKKYTFKSRSAYSLNHISDVELGDEKTNYDEYDNFFEFWENDPQKFVDYNIKDVELIDQLDEKLGLLNLHCSLAYKAKCNFSDALGSIKIWDIMIYHYLKDKNILIPPMVKKEFEPYAGAYVKEPKKGIYDWLVSVDLNSLYPHLIMQYNISPETIIDDQCIHGLMSEKKLDDRFLNKDFEFKFDDIIAANGQYFRKDIRGFLPEMMESLYSERKQIKKNMLHKQQEMFDSTDACEKKKLKNISTNLNNEQMSLKILLVSLYGSLANKYSRYFDIRLTTAITLSGQLSIKWIEKYLMDHLKQKKFKWNVVYIDTDSCLGNTKIYVNNKQITIEDYYDKLNGEMIIDDSLNEHYVKKIENGDTSLSVSKNFKIENNSINYIMKHKTTKEMFEIEVEGKKVIVTEDHSVIVKRKNEMISVTPKEILETDELIYID
jgi:DNA polymerase elongation subunit (family B)